MSRAQLNILAVEPYFGGLRRDFLEGLRAHSRHKWTLLTLPARNRPWRIRASALHFAQQMRSLRRRFDLLFVTDLVNLADLLALSPPQIRQLPAVAYFHENSLPRLRAGIREPGAGIMNITTALAARQAWFNSEHHRERFLASAETIMSRAPDYAPPRLVEAIRSRCRIMPPGANLAPFVPGPKKARPGKGPLTILWNHRWEDDKNPEDFFGLLFLLADEGYPFHLAVVGETLRKWPPVFRQARRKLGSRMVQFGYLPKREDYIRTVRQADIVVSTALEEFFSPPAVEAIAAGLYPLLPGRLSYPEIIPEKWHREFLYRDDRGLRSRLIRLLDGKADWVPARQMSRHIQSYDWHNLIRKCDDALARAAAGSED